MKFKDLEKIVNEEVLVLKDYSGKEIENATLDCLLRNVCEKISSILEKNNVKGVKLKAYNQKIYLESEKYYTFYRNQPSGVVIKVKKEVAGSNHDWFGTSTYYKFKNIEIEKVERYIDEELIEIETIEDYLEYKEKMNQQQKEKIQNKKEEFINKVDDMEKFLTLMKEFKLLNYDTKKEIAVSVFGEDYWKYIN